MSTKRTPSIGLKLMNIALFVSFIVTNLVPLTGVPIHKIASTLFLLLCIVHTIVYRRKLKKKTIALLGVVLVSFFSGVLCMIFWQYPLTLALHKVISIASVFFLAIHIFLFHRRVLKK